MTVKKAKSCKLPIAAGQVIYSFVCFGTAAYISHIESEMKSADCEKSLLTHSSITPREPLTIKVYVVFNVQVVQTGIFLPPLVRYVLSVYFAALV